MLDLTNLTDDELRILDAVFCSFDQGDFSFDLEHIKRDPECYESPMEEKDNIYDLYCQMRDQIEEAGRKVLPKVPLGDVK